MEIKLAETDTEIFACYPVMRELRPHILELDSSTESGPSRLPAGLRTHCGSIRGQSTIWSVRTVGGGSDHVFLDAIVLVFFRRWRFRQKGNGNYSLRASVPPKASDALVFPKRVLTLYGFRE